MDGDVQPAPGHQPTLKEKEVEGSGDAQDRWPRGKKGHINLTVIFLMPARRVENRAKKSACQRYLTGALHSVKTHCKGRHTDMFWTGMILRNSCLLMSYAFSKSLRPVSWAVAMYTM